LRGEGGKERNRRTRAEAFDISKGSTWKGQIKAQKKDLCDGLSRFWGKGLLKKGGGKKKKASGTREKGFSNLK